MKKTVVILLLVLLSIYSPVELSRLIIIYGVQYGFFNLDFELAIIWICYISMVIILAKVIRRK